MATGAHASPTKLIFGLVLIAAGVFIVFWGQSSFDQNNVNSYAECVAAGNGIEKTNPPQCRTPNGTVFVEGITIGIIDTFEECAAAGYPILESYPEQCKTPDGKSFTRTISSGCVNDSTCTQGYFCKLGLCTEFSPETSCDTDADCTLINVTQRFSCCYAGACDAIDYSNKKWIAVNAEWFNAGRSQYCPTSNQCGPQPGCATQVVNDQYTTACINRLCEKKSIPLEGNTYYCDTTLPYEPPGPELTAYEQYHSECGAYTTQPTCASANVSNGCQWASN